MKENLKYHSPEFFVDEISQSCILCASCDVNGLQIIQASDVIDASDQFSI